MADIGSTLSKYTSSAELSALLESDKFGIVSVKTYGAVGDGVTDDTSAIQDALDSNNDIYFPEGTYKITSTLTSSVFGLSIIGANHKYGASKIKYYGTGKAITLESAVSYATFKNIALEGTPTTSTDYYNTGTVGLDVTSGVSIECDNSWISNFEKIIESNFNSFYNKFTNNRFEKFKYCLYNFSINNLIFDGNRCQRFYQCIVANGSNGALTVSKNAFEIFNDAIVATTGDEKGIINFNENYVEIYDDVDLPTNFPNNEARGAKVGKFGGNILFTGPVSVINIENNEIQLQGVFRISLLSKCDNYYSKGNNLHLFETGNLLNSMHVISSPTIKSLYINDSYSENAGDGGYVQAYSQAAIEPISPYTEYYFYDCISDKVLTPSKNVLTPTLTNGWYSYGATNFYGVPKAIITKEGIHLQGVVSGDLKTANQIFTIPASQLPYEITATNKSFHQLMTYSNFGSELIRLRYLYTTGVLQLEGTPVNLTNIALDNLFIPART